MKRYIKNNANVNRKTCSVGSVNFPRNMTFLSIITPDYKKVWEGEAYSVDDIPTEYRGLAVIDRYRNGDSDDPDFGESFTVIVENYNDNKYVKSSVTEDTSYAKNLIRISSKDAKYALSQLNKSHKTLGLYGVPGDPGYYVSEFEKATPGFMWSSDTGLKILDDAGIQYELIKPVKE